MEDVRSSCEFCLMLIDVLQSVILNCEYLLVYQTLARAYVAGTASRVGLQGYVTCCSGWCSGDVGYSCLLKLLPYGAIQICLLL